MKDDGALTCMVEDFRHILTLYKNMSSFYGAGVGYSEGAMDTLISINTLYKMVFARVLEEKES